MKFEICVQMSHWLFFWLFVFRINFLLIFSYKTLNKICKKFQLFMKLYSSPIFVCMYFDQENPILSARLAYSLVCTYIPHISCIYINTELVVQIKNLGQKK